MPMTPERSGREKEYGIPVPIPAAVVTLTGENPDLSPGNCNVVGIPVTMAFCVYAAFEFVVSET